MVAIGVIIAFAASARGQTCYDGCNDSNTYQGSEALISLTSGSQDTAFGAYALTSNKSGSKNTAIGAYAMEKNEWASDATAVGFSALNDNYGEHNTAVGSFALRSSGTGDNTAIGYSALSNCTWGSNNTASGSLALQFNTTGYLGTATGSGALQANTTGYHNTATGAFSLHFNTTGYENTANGADALGNNTTGSSNTASGEHSLYYSFGDNNTAMGASALFFNTTGRNNIALGYRAGYRLIKGSDNIHIGHEGETGDTNTIRIGRRGAQAQTFIAGITGQTVAGGIAVMIDAKGRLGTITSSSRFKEKIEPMGGASEAILSLEPVSFRYKKELDSAGIPQFGLVAEEVAKVDRDLVAFDDQGKPYTVRYEAVNAMLLNEFLKEHRRVEELEKTVAELRTAAAKQSELAATIAKLEVALRFQAERLEKVSARVEGNPPAERWVVNP